MSERLASEFAGNQAEQFSIVVPDVALRSAAGEALVGDLRAIDAPYGFGVEGAAAELVDSKTAIADRLHDRWVFGRPPSAEPADKPVASVAAARD